MFCSSDSTTYNSTETKERALVFFNITEVSPTSDVTLTFSESLFSLNEFDILNLDKNLFNDFRKGIINISYESTID